MSLQYLLQWHRIASVELLRTRIKCLFPLRISFLLQKGNKSFVKGVVSDDNGVYFFEEIAEGTYQIEISVLGFRIKKTETFELVENITFDFTLEEEAQSLDEVIVKSQRPVIRQTTEKLVVDLENSELINTNLQDIMRKVPGVFGHEQRNFYSGKQRR